MDKVMYKVLIADDEFWIREKIKNMIEWNKYSLELLEPAKDGEDVLNKIEEHSADILITDINMPFINGVELVRLIKEKYPNIIIFIISGYSNFHYVKDTLVAGAINYLLKPITKVDLVSTLSKALEILGNRKRLEMKQEEERLNSLKASSLIQDREFSFILEREDNQIGTVMNIDDNTHFTKYSIVVFVIHNLEELIQHYEYDMNMLSYNVKKKIKDIIGRDDIIIFNYIHYSNQFIFITDIEHRELVGYANKIVSYFQSVIKSPLSLLVTEPSYSIDNLNNAYNNVISKLMTRKYNKKSEILMINTESCINEKVINHISQEDEKNIKKLLYVNNKSLLKKIIFEKIGLESCNEEGWTYREVYQTIKKICDILMEFISDELKDRSIEEVQRNIAKLNKSIDYLDEKKLIEILKVILSDIINLNNVTSADSIIGAVHKAIKYIDDNYSEELSLNVIADKYNVEHSYFSKVFRQETGVNLMSYIAQKRIDKAKQYMKNPYVKLTDIAFMVGYDDYAYFNRVFRKIEGISPRDYRNI
jgi:Response regulator containing CheY-like receiver domain and AraC-type DNA-binding domain